MARAGNEEYRGRRKKLDSKSFTPQPIQPPPAKPYDVEGLEPGEKFLTDKQALFVTEYLRDGNGKAAAERAGVDPKQAAGISWAWLNDEKKYGHVQRAVRQGMADKRKACAIDAKEVVGELAQIAFLNIKECIGPDGVPLPVHQMPDHVTSAIKRLKVAYKTTMSEGELAEVKIVDLEFHDKLVALKQLAQHLGLLKDGDHYHQHVHIDWQALFNRKPPEVIKQEDIIDQKLTAIEKLALPAPEDGHDDQQPPS